MKTMTTIDLKIETKNPDLLDKTVNTFGAAVVKDSFDGSTCKVRCFGNADFVKFACINQGYGKIVSEEIITQQ